MPTRSAALVCALLVLSGCGSGAPLPPAAEPARSPELRAEPEGRVTTTEDRPADTPTGRAALDDGTPVVVDRTRRRLRVGDEEVPAGVGPSDVAVGDGGRLYVTDTDGGSILLFRTRPELTLVRRAAVPGKPYAAATDRERGKLWVTVTETNEAVQLTADGAPRIQRRFPTVRQPNAIAIDDRSGRVVVGGADGQVQVFDGYPAPRLSRR